jgi:Flp pilus assembly protein TadG
MNTTASNNLRRSRFRKGALLSLELVIALPVLLTVIFAAVEFSFLLLGSQAITAAANVGARQAALPSSTSSDVNYAVFSALQSWRWAQPNQLQVLVFVDTNGDGDLELVSDSFDSAAQQDPSNALASAPTGTEVQVTVKLPSTTAAPNLLSIVGLSLTGQELTASFVSRKE